jgi:hypothetical protein
MGEIGFRFVMLFRLHGSEKLTAKKSLPWHEKREYTAPVQVGMIVEVG